MTYTQITSEERYMLSRLRTQGSSVSQIAEAMGRHRSTIYRELERNSQVSDGFYRPFKAQERTNGRRSRSRRNRRISVDDLALVEQGLARKWSPEQIACRFRHGLLLQISHETIYRHVWRDKKAGGSLYLNLRQHAKRRRKRYGAYDSRGRLAGKRHISERPAVIEERSEFGHWEIDTVMGSPDQHCIVTLVERLTGLLLIGKLTNRTAEQLTRVVVELILQQPPGTFKTITADNGSEFHDYKSIEALTNVTVYFATPHHSWERGTCENTNGLIRQYLPKRLSMKRLDQKGCETISDALNSRPRKRHDYFTPEEIRRSL